VNAGGDINNLSLVIPTNGRLGGTNGSVPDLANLAVQGGGDLNVHAGGDINSGIFYVASGVGVINAQGSLGSARVKEDGSPIYSLIALGDAQLNITAGADLDVQNIFNPTIVSQVSGNAGPGSLTKDKLSYFLTYSDESSIDLTSLAGDIRLLNDGEATSGALITDKVNANATTDSLNIYPGMVSAMAASGSIEISGTPSLLPNAHGQLDLLAAQDVILANSNSSIRMSDVSPATLSGMLTPTADFSDISGALANASEAGSLYHDPSVLHANDYEPSHIVALEGSVIGQPDASFLTMAESVIVDAGQDVRNFSLIGQNVREGDATVIRAGRDIVYFADRKTGEISNDTNSIIVGGPGRVQLTAGRNVDLGASKGVLTVGNQNNPYLPTTGASIFAQAGLNGAADYVGFVNRYVVTAGSATGGRDYLHDLVDYMRNLTGNASLTEQEAVQAYAGLLPEQQAAFANPVFYGELRYAGRDAADPGSASFKDYTSGRNLIATLFPDAYQGDVNLFFSQIKTMQGGDIELLAPGGIVNAGLANSGGLTKSASELGVVTVNGGSVLSMVKDDFLVNQSRVFTLGGGDIFIWADQGDIDAGKGAKTATATPAPVLRLVDGKLQLDISQSVAGSGIGVLLAKSGITPGDVDLIAPNGEINAGDAGIQSAGNLTLAAIRVVGADNIKVGGVSTGVPVANTSGLSGATAGIGDAASGATKSASEEVAKQVAQNNNPFDTSKSFLPSFITVEVIGLGDDKEKQ
jgi:hypothetical protein